jgi:hypothetical protein
MDFHSRGEKIHHHRRGGRGGVFQEIFQARRQFTEQLAGLATCLKNSCKEIMRPGGVLKKFIQ